MNKQAEKALKSAGITVKFSWSTAGQFHFIVGTKAEAARARRIFANIARHVAVDSQTYPVEAHTVTVTA